MGTVLVNMFTTARQLRLCFRGARRVDNHNVGFEPFAGRRGAVANCGRKTTHESMNGYTYEVLPATGNLAPFDWILDTVPTVSAEDHELAVVSSCGGEDETWSSFVLWQGRAISAGDAVVVTTTSSSSILVFLTEADGNLGGPLFCQDQSLLFWMIGKEGVVGEGKEKEMDVGRTMR